MSEGSPKADQWRNLGTVLVVALYHAWQVDGTIPDTDAPAPKSKTKAGRAAKRKEDLVRGRLREDIAHDQDATIDDLDAADDATMDRNYRRHFDTVTEHATAIRIWGTHEITPADVQRAQRCHGRACRSWARMNVHLTPNFHFSEHNEPALLRLGPFPGWWGWPMEQFNGFLKKVKNNGRAGGQIEGTMMRAWWKYSLLSDLVRFLTSFNPSLS